MQTELARLTVAALNEASDELFNRLVGTGLTPTEAGARVGAALTAHLEATVAEAHRAAACDAWLATL